MHPSIVLLLCLSACKKPEAPVLPPPVVEVTEIKTGSVPLTTTLIGQLDSPQNVEWSNSICTGLQLANFWQDVARDAVIGRTYLPREDRLRFGYTDEQLQLGSSTPEFTGLLKHEVERARAYFRAKEAAV